TARVCEWRLHAARKTNTPPRRAPPPMALLAALFPPEHPYHWTTIGEIDDLNAVQLDEVHAFFRRYYHPAHASWSRAGDFDSDEALALARAYFEDLDPGDRVAPVEASALLPGDS